MVPGAWWLKEARVKWSWKSHVQPCSLAFCSSNLPFLDVIHYVKTFRAVLFQNSLAVIMRWSSKFLFLQKCCMNLWVNIQVLIISQFAVFPLQYPRFFLSCYCPRLSYVLWTTLQVFNLQPRHPSWNCINHDSHSTKSPSSVLAPDFHKQ